MSIEEPYQESRTPPVLYSTTALHHSLFRFQQDDNRKGCSLLPANAIPSPIPASPCSLPTLPIMAPACIFLLLILSAPFHG